ncbi:hypothetical protein CACET_c39250 [Clostridium aceticum]|uniref:Aromatic acid exporter family member 1 n=1 Tax=Clostridium aceticum TaxID=84022 RepID=A0A0G3WFA8_9CLOT|nr:aromatic acid exporter family protein [Clostridium aceticum]AKL97351.1 hypothetical protein CACET_c39250 [Clostridium aceticum]
MKIGLRTIKTGIAVTVSLIIANILRIESPFFAAIAAIIAMQPTVSDSWKTGVNRILGTIIGAVVGAIFVAIAPANPFLGGLGVVSLIIIMNKLGWQEAIAIGGVVFTGIFLNTNENHVTYALHRLLDTSIGIVVAVVINYTIYPPTYDLKVAGEIKNISKHILRYNIKTLEILLQEEEQNMSFLEEQIEEIEKELELSEKLLDLQKKEEKIKVHGGIRHKEMFISLKLEKETFEHLRNMQNVLQKGIGREIIDLAKEDLYKIKEALKEVQCKENEVCDIYNQKNKDDINLEYIIEDIKKAKMQLKNKEDINNYPTDEVVKMLVFLYNLQEVLQKFNMIICC